MLKRQIIHTYLVLDVIYGLLELCLLRLHRLQGKGLLRHTHQTLIKMQLGSIVLKIGNGPAENQPKLFTVDLGRAQGTVVDERLRLHMLVVCGAFLGHVLCKTLHADPMGDNQVGCLDSWCVHCVLLAQITD